MTYYIYENYWVEGAFWISTKRSESKAINDRYKGQITCDSLEQAITATAKEFDTSTWFVVETTFVTAHDLRRLFLETNYRTPIVDSTIINQMIAYSLKPLKTEDIRDRDNFLNFIDRHTIKDS
jgi:hypothetical protein